MSARAIQLGILGWIFLLISSETSIAQIEGSAVSPDIPKAAIDAKVAENRASNLQIDKDLTMFRAIRDDARFPWADPAPRDDQLREIDDLEERAFDEVLRFARQFSSQELVQNARRDVMYRDLMQPGRMSFKLELVYMEGRLRRLRRTDPSPVLKESGINDLYEIWIFPKDESNPLCFFATEIPASLTPNRNFNSDGPSPWVGVAGYSFKLLRYDSAERDPANPERTKVRRAPVLIGRSIVVISEPPPSDGGLAWRQTFMPVIVLGFAGVASALALLAFWFRRGDRKVQGIIETSLNRNPFESHS